MTDPTTRAFEARLSEYQIEKATARLAYQRAVVRRLGPNADGRLAQVAIEMLVAMEVGLAALLLNHVNLLEAQANAPEGVPERGTCSPSETEKSEGCNVAPPLLDDGGCSSEGVIERAFKPVGRRSQQVETGRHADVENTNWPFTART